MLRASEGLDNLAIMLPMICTVSEIKASRRLLDQAWREVSEEAASRNAEIRYPSLGVMIEVPSALYILPEMAPLIDFWSVGSNDSRIANIYDASNRYQKPVSVCCELAGDPVGVLLLLAMDYRRFSMKSHNIARIKYVLRGLFVRYTGRARFGRLAVCRSQTKNRLIDKHALSLLANDRKMRLFL